MNRFVMFWLAVTAGLVCAATYAASVVYPLGDVVMWTAVAGGAVAAIAACWYGHEISEARWMVTLLLALGVVFMLSDAYNPGFNPEAAVKLGMALAFASLIALGWTVGNMIRKPE
ncbi:MAG TPA: hypothetical protein VGE53_00030 [Candidatus Paceibacterota bacterium]